jgi:NADPH-dependent 2,4-dienoyl-CoA reductase/sulfur reductase-like enzyme
MDVGPLAVAVEDHDELGWAVDGGEGVGCHGDHTAHTVERPGTVERHCDVAVIGGSAAELAAALQLGRQRRSVIIVDAGEPRNAPAEHVHGYLGGEGLAPSELTAAGREQVRSYGNEVLAGRATWCRSSTRRFPAPPMAAGSTTC